VNFPAVAQGRNKCRELRRGVTCVKSCVCCLSAVSTATARRSFFLDGSIFKCILILRSISCHSGPLCYPTMVVYKCRNHDTHQQTSHQPRVHLMASAKNQETAFGGKSGTHNVHTHCCSEARELNISPDK